MRTIKRASAFRRDYKREKRGRYAGIVSEEIGFVADALASDLPLPERYRDHALWGDWNGYRECHLRPDLLLVYRKLGADRLELARLGSHSELFG